MNDPETLTPYDRGICIRILSLRAQNEGAEVAVKLLLESGEHSEQVRQVLSTEQYCALKLCRGVISAELYEQIEEAAELHRAVKRGEYLLGYGSNSARALSQKLRQRGFSREISDQAALILQNRGLIDEEGDLCREVERCLRKLWGAGRIRSALWAKGYGREAMQGLSELLEDVDFAENCAELIRKKYGEVPDDPQERRRMMAALARAGYSAGEIKQAFMRIRR